MSVRIRGRKVPAEVRPVRSGWFLRAAVHVAATLQAGSIVEVNGEACVVKYLIPGEPTETETWAILLPVRDPVVPAEAATMHFTRTRPAATGRPAAKKLAKRGQADPGSSFASSEINPFSS